MTLHPAITRAAADAARIATPRGTSPAAWRAQALKIDQEVTRRYMKPAPDCLVRDVNVPRPAHPPVRVRLYSPIDKRPTGALLHFFGGAFRQGGVHYPSSDITNRSRAAMSGILVAAVDYSLSPESSFPAPVEQGLAVLKWLADNASELGFPTGNIAVGGLSAGGNIAAAVALAARDSGGTQPLFQLLEAPVLDLTGGHFRAAAASELGLDWPIVRQDLIDMGRLYLNGVDPTIPRASPLLASNIRGLPPAHVFTAEFDVFRGDGEAFVHLLQAAGIPAVEHHFAGMTHDSHFFDLVLPEAIAWRQEAELLLRTLFRV